LGKDRTEGSTLVQQVNHVSGTATRPLLHSSDGDNEPADLDVDLDSLSGMEARVLDPSASKLHPRIKRALRA